MSNLEDEPVRFFLEHQHQIAEWAQLADAAHEATANVLRDFRGDLAVDGRVAERGIQVGDHVLGEPATGPVLYRSEWAPAGEAPDVAVGLGWDGPVDPARVWPRTSRPYSGILTSHRSERGLTIEQKLRAHADTAYGGGSGSERPRVRAGTYWIVYRPVESPTDWWRDIPAWKMEWIDRLLRDWDQWAPLIDTAIDELSHAALAQPDGTL